MRFLLWADPQGGVCRFAPLGGQTFQSLLNPEERAGLPDSLVLRTSDGRLLTRSAGVLHLLKRLGPRWRRLAALLALVPRPIRDLLYDGVARIRLRLFERPAELCPRVPLELRERFLP